MLQRIAVMTAAWLEIVVGVTAIAALGVMCRLLFAAEPDGVAIPLGRLAGIALIALGIACLPSRSAESCRNAVLGLFVYNFGTAILLAWVGIATTLRGALLWPGVLLHVVIAVALLMQLLARRRVGTSQI
ncbi:MAG TPA: hypothetical protein VKH40_14830 [Alloacidobacterium sp.]|nr:hypothetical protein [Alloacidobacterium sp.]